ncbi:MAG: hypothetical protein QM759_17505 [Terricaulis sp.]
MSNWLVPLMHVIDSSLVFVIALFLTVISLVIGGVCMFNVQTAKRYTPERARWRRRFDLARNATILSAVLGFGAMFLGAAASITQFTPELRGPIASVTVEGRLMASPGSLISALRQMGPAPAHHSHPIEPGKAVTLATTKGSLTFTLKRDSGDPHEYWVFYSSPGQLPIDVDRVFTDQLDGY